MDVNIALLTVTDTRTFDNDKSGAILVEKIKEAKHKLIDRKICKDNKEDIVKILKEYLKIECPINQASKKLNLFFKKNKINLRVQNDYFPITKNKINYHVEIFQRS